MKRNYWPTAEWKDEDPAALNMDAEKLSELDAAIKEQYDNINGIVIIKNGSLAFERYYNGFGCDDAHHVASVTKSVISALVGIALENGYIKDPDDRVLDFFPEYIPEAKEQQKREITIRHLLTMTVPYPFEDWKEPMEQLCMQPDWITFTLDMMGKNGNVGAFKYCTAGAHLLSAVIARSTGKSAREFANEHLFRPLGMREIPDHKMKAFGFDDLFGKDVKGWVKDPAGNSTGGWGLTLTPRDMARFGFLYLNHGIWENQQILSEEWIAGSTAMNSNHFGYLWWLFGDKETFAYAALGDGGNVICCIPEKDLVIAIASGFTMNPRDRWTMIKEWILPAVKD